MVRTHCDVCDEVIGATNGKLKPHYVVNVSAFSTLQTAGERVQGGQKDLNLIICRSCYQKAKGTVLPVPSNSKSREALEKGAKLVLVNALAVLGCLSEMHQEQG
jgi:hypothetical protein